MIPEQLKKEEIRFNILGIKQKIAIEKDWQNTKNYKYNDERLQKAIKEGYNYGVLCGNDLIVIDADTPELKEIVEGKFLPTFTVTTGKGTHYYYICKGFNQKKVLKEGEKHLGEIQSVGTYVVGPNSTHPNGAIYQITNPMIIQTISMQIISKAFSKYYANEQFRKEVIISGSEEGLRNESMFKIACSLKSKGLSAEETIGTLNAINQKNNPPLPEQEVLQIVRSSYSYQDEKKPLIPTGVLKVTNYMDNVNLFHSKQPFFYDKSRIFWFWNNEEYRWEIVDEIDLMNNIEKTLGFNGETVTSKTKSNYLEAFKRIGRLNLPKEAKIKYVQFKDKVVNIEDGKIHPVESRFFFTNPIPWEIGQSEETPTIDKLFEEWVGKKYVKTLYEIIAYCCLRNYPIQVLFCFIGGGRNGKTQFQKLLVKFLGCNNVCSTELDLLLGNRFESFKLYRKLACTLGETNFGLLNNTSLLKKLTGGDLIGFEKKNKDPFDEYNYSKILINSNSLPSSQDTSEGFYRRWVIIDFPNQFKEGKDIIETIPDIEYNNLCNKVMKTLPSLLKKGSFTNQGSVKDRKEKYIEASNPLPLFIEKFCDIESEGWVRYSEFYSGYCLYLSKRNRRVVSRQEFSKFLDMEGYEKRKTTKTIKSEFGNDKYESGHFVEGIELKGDWKKIMTDMTDMITFSLRDPTGGADRESSHNGHNEHKPLEPPKIPLEVVKDCLNDLGGVLKLIPVMELVKSCDIYDIDEVKVEEIIEKLKKVGYIFEPKPGFIQLI